MDIELFKATLNKQYEKAKKFELHKKPEKGEETEFVWKWKYDPWLLEPMHIAKAFGVELPQLEKLLLKLKDNEIMEAWIGYKSFQITSMMYDERFKPIVPQLAEFALGKFDKTETSKTDVIVEMPSIEKTKYEVEISRLKKELESKGK